LGKYLNEIYLYPKPIISGFMWETKTHIVRGESTIICKTSTCHYWTTEKKQEEWMKTTMEMFH